MLTPQQLRTREDGYRNAQLVDCFEQYEKILRRAGALDFDDLLLRAVSLLRRHDRVREKYADRYRHVLVDEYQDTNHAQYELTPPARPRPPQRLRRRRPRTRPSTAGAAPTSETSERSRTTSPNAPSSTSNATTARAATSSPPPRRSSPATRTAPTRPCGPGRAPGAEIEHLRTESDHDEADAITGIVHTEPAEPRRTAVLYRTNAQSRLIEDSLRRAEIPYHIVGNIRFYERKEIKDALAYLKVIVNPHDDVSLRRIINSPPRGIGPRSIDKAAGPPGARSARRHAVRAGASRSRPGSIALDTPERRLRRAQAHGPGAGENAGVHRPDRHAARQRGQRCHRQDRRDDDRAHGGT